MQGIVNGNQMLPKNYNNSTSHHFDGKDIWFANKIKSLQNENLDLQNENNQLKIKNIYFQNLTLAVQNENSQLKDKINQLKEQNQRVEKEKSALSIKILQKINTEIENHTQKDDLLTELDALSADAFISTEGERLIRIFVNMDWQKCNTFFSSFFTLPKFQSLTAPFLKKMVLIFNSEESEEAKKNIAKIFINNSAIIQKLQSSDLKNLFTFSFDHNIEDNEKFITHCSADTKFFESLNGDIKIRFLKRHHANKTVIASLQRHYFIQEFLEEMNHIKGIDKVNIFSLFISSYKVNEQTLNNLSVENFIFISENFALFLNEILKFSKYCAENKNTLKIKTNPTNNYFTKLREITLILIQNNNTRILTLLLKKYPNLFSTKEIEILITKIEDQSILDELLSNDIPNNKISHSFKALHIFTILNSWVSKVNDTQEVMKFFDNYKNFLDDEYNFSSKLQREFHKSCKLRIIKILETSNYENIPDKKAQEDIAKFLNVHRSWSFGRSTQSYKAFTQIISLHTIKSNDKQAKIKKKIEDYKKQSIQKQSLSVFHLVMYNCQSYKGVLAYFAKPGNEPIKYRNSEKKLKNLTSEDSPIFDFFSL